MKLLFFTDLHLKATNPRWRVGDYGQDILDKIEAVVHLSFEYNCDCLVLGGDFIDSWNVSLSLANKAINLLARPTVGVFGQHDLIGHDVGMVSSTPACLLYWAFDDGFKIEEDFFVKKGGAYIHLYNYRDDTEYLKILETATPEEVAVVHGMIVPKPVPWPHVCIEEIETDAKIVLSGDYHPGFPPTLHDGTWFINPGALARISIEDRNRTPSVAIVDLDKLPDCPAEYVPIPCKPKEEVFDLEGYEAMADRTETASKYTEMLKQMVAGGQSSWEAMFETARQEGVVEEEIIDSAYKRCVEVAGDRMEEKV